MKILYFLFLHGKNSQCLDFTGFKGNCSCQKSKQVSSNELCKQLCYVSRIRTEHSMKKVSQRMYLNFCPDGEGRMGSFSSANSSSGRGQTTYKVDWASSSKKFQSLPESP